uniref:Unc-93 homolog B1, TLR signaling regulator n=1 Tax=Scophthalmus maximus TaxID=52904 RepID=A0A8D3AY18_SCOMX
MEATDIEEHGEDADFEAPPNGGMNELLHVGQEENIQGQMEEFLGPHSEYNEEEEEKKYYRRKRLGVIKNVVAASVGAMIVYSVYMGLLQMQLILHYDMTYREVKYSNLGLEDIDRKMLMGINVTPIIGLLYTPVLIRFLGTKWMMFLASGIYALFVSTNYWERYYTLVQSAVAIGVVIVPLWASLGNYITRMAQQYYEYVNYKEEHVQEQKKLPKGACHRYIIVFQSVFHIIFFLSFVFAEFPMRLVLNGHLHKTKHILFNVKVCGAAVSGLIPGFNTTVLTKLPRSMLLIQVESVLMGFAFLAMIVFLVLCGAAYRPTEEIDLRSIGWGNIFQLPFKHLRDYRLRLLSPFFIYSGFEALFAVTGFSLSYGVCILGLDRLWLLIVVYGLSCSVFSFLPLCILRLPRWTCLASGAAVHLVLLVALLAFSLQRDRDLSYEQYLGPLLVISVLWGLGTALNKTGLSTVLGMLYAEEKERLDFVYTIYHWCQAIAIFIVYLWSHLPMRAKLSILLATLLLACYCYWVMERRLASDVRPRLPRIPRPRHKVKGYRYLEEDNSDESDSERSDDDEELDKENEGDVVEEMGAEDREERVQDGGAQGDDSPRARRKSAREGERKEKAGERRRDGGRMTEVGWSSLQERRDTHWYLFIYWGCLLENFHLTLLCHSEGLYQTRWV